MLFKFSTVCLKCVEHTHFYLLVVYKLIAFQRNLISGICILISQCILMTQISLALSM